MRLIGSNEPNECEMSEVQNHGYQDNELGAVCRRAVLSADVVTCARPGANAGSQVRADPKGSSRRDPVVRQGDRRTDLFVAADRADGTEDGVRRGIK
jgi:hypothetical protein